MTVVLVIQGIVVLLLIVLIRNYIASRKMSALSTTVESVIRIGLCLAMALGTYFWYSKGGYGLSFWLGSLAAALIIYAITHLVDRWVLK